MIMGGCRKKVSFSYSDGAMGDHWGACSSVGAPFRTWLLDHQETKEMEIDQYFDWSR